MRIVLHGGFGEKGRTCVGIESDSYCLLLDAGVKPSTGSEYYPAISDEALRASDAIVLTHAHEDHLAALGWFMEHGFSGRIFITAESQREVLPCISAYGKPLHQELVRRAKFEIVPAGNGWLELGPVYLATGRSGHVVGGFWCMVGDETTRFLYCGDVVPASSIFVMDPLPQCDVIAIDASYSDDATSIGERVAQIRQWVASHPEGSVLPTPRYGRSVELLALLHGPLALAPGMRDALRAQIADPRWLTQGACETLTTRLDAAVDWHEGDALPQAALLCDDAMGFKGPSRAILDIARSTGHATLFTGHLPEGSLGHAMLAEGHAEHLRLPTHPTLPENIAMVHQSEARIVLGHSCERPDLERLARHIPSLRVDAVTGKSLEL